jgi:Domain of unknown function (DUF6378)
MVRLSGAAFDANREDGLTQVLSERNATHGDWLRQATTAEDLLRVVSARKPVLSDSQSQALTMILMKVSRIVCGNPDEPDHWRDIAGYATLAMTALPEKGFKG